jgi:hypothetical protein
VVGKDPPHHRGITVDIRELRISTGVHEKNCALCMPILTRLIIKKMVTIEKYILKEHMNN